jgi:hypothetical protein
MLYKRHAKRDIPPLPPPRYLSLSLSIFIRFKVVSQGSTKLILLGRKIAREIRPLSNTPGLCSRVYSAVSGESPSLNLQCNIYQFVIYLTALFVAQTLRCFFMDYRIMISKLYRKKVILP